MIDFTHLIDLASAAMGGAVVAANDEFFAPKENLIKVERPIFIEDRYTDRGKWMDGWETRRRREPGHDWAIVRLGAPGVVRGVIVDTAHFKGNYPESCSIDGCDAPPEADDRGLAGRGWTEILAQTRLAGDQENRSPVAFAGRISHVRLNIFPDGGVARLRVYGRAQPDWPSLRAAGGELDLAAAAHGGLVVSTSDMFFGHAHNMIMPGEPRDMRDGWETKRRRGPGHDWAIVELGAPGVVRRLVVDTTHFKGNAPGSCEVEGCHATGAAPEALAAAGWETLLRQTPLAAHTRHEFPVTSARAVTHVRLKIYPDGGVSRFRVFGRPG
jgi:allantoicase